MKGESAKIIEKIQQFHPRNSMAWFNIWHFSTSKNRTNRSPGSCCHGLVVLTEFLVAEALQTSFLSDPGVVLSGVFGACWSIVDGTVSVICFWWWDVALEKTCKQRTFLNLYIYTLYKYSFDFFMYGCKCISYIDINPNDTVCHFRDCISILAWNLRYDQPTWEIWLGLQVDSYGPLIMQQNQRGNVRSIPRCCTKRNLEILYIFYLTYLRLERDEELKKQYLGVNSSLLWMNHFPNSQYNSFLAEFLQEIPDANNWYT